MDNTLNISNSGQELISTNYWHTEHANVGLCYLSGNAGAWRLLIPEAAEMILSELKGVNKAVIEPTPSRRASWDIVFEDGTETPFSLTIDARQVDRVVRPGFFALALWTQRGKVLSLPCEVRK